jgi:hypothetical protein
MGQILAQVALPAFSCRQRHRFTPAGEEGTSMSIPTAKPSKRIIDIRSLTYALAGPEQPYPVYQFSRGRARIEYPKHNPFQHVPPYY